MKQVDIKTRVIPNKPRSGNYPVGSTVVRGGSSGGDTTIINQGGADLSTLRQQFLSKKSDDTANGIITFLKGIKIASNLIRYILKEEDANDITDEAVMPASRVIKEIQNNQESLKDLFIRKDIPDSTQFLLSLLGGAIFGKDGFAEGLTGFGAKIGADGRGEMRSLKVWEELIVPLLVYNRVDIVIGDKWRSPGAGVIESVTPDTDAEGNQLPSGTATLKLEDGEIGAIAVDDMNMGIWHFGDERDATEDNDDGIGNFNFAGFTTAYWRITEIQDKDNKTFRYVLRDGYNVHPQPQMKFSCRGNFTNEKRQTSVYETRTYTRMLWKQNDWEIGKRNIALQYGDLSNLNIFGINATGYAFYGNSLYFTGTVTQIREDGTEVMVANDRTDWSPGDFAAYYDRVSYEGGLWLCLAKEGTNTIPSKDDPAWLLQVKSGDSIKSYRRWKSSETPYAYGSIVPFADRVFMAATDTSNPPFPLVTDNEGNYIVVTEDGGKTYHYIIAEYTQSEDWTLLLDISGITNGADGESLYVRYSSDKTNWHDTFQEGDIWMQQKLGDGAWSDDMRIVGEAGADGKDAQYQEFQFAVNNSLTVAPTTGWQDAPPAVGTGQYLWTRTGIVVPPATVPSNWVAVRIGGEKGESGTSVKNGGRWRTGLVVDAMTLVTMGGKTFLSKVRTSNPPMWTVLDNYENRIMTSDGGYILTGEMNTDEYELIVENGADGKDAVTYEYIYQRTTLQSSPATPSTAQYEGYVPSGWSATSQGVSDLYPYEWRCERKRSSAGIWSEWSSPSLVSSYGKQGLQGCVVRDSEWTTGVQYRNDSALTTNTGVRYIDVVLVRNDGTTTGWDAYQCKKTHVSSSSITYTNTEYWDKFDTNVGAIFTSLILAKNAKINFLSGNQLTIAHSQTGKPCLGLSGADGSGAIRLWIGSEIPDNAPYKVDEDGKTIYGNGNIIFNPDGSATIGKKGISIDKNGEVDMTNILRNPFIGLIAQIIPNGGGTGIALHEYSLTNYITNQRNNNYLVNTVASNAIFRLRLPSDVRYSGATIHIFNNAPYNSGTYDNKYLSIEGIPSIFGGSYKLYGTGIVTMIGIGTSDTFIGWKQIGLI